MKNIEPGVGALIVSVMALIIALYALFRPLSPQTMVTFPTSRNMYESEYSDQRCVLSEFAVHTAKRKLDNTWEVSARIETRWQHVLDDMDGIVESDAGSAGHWVHLILSSAYSASDVNEWTRDLCERLYALATQREYETPPT